MAGFGLRPDKTEKGTGFLGVLNRPDGRVSTEISIGVNFDGKETLIPTLVPTLDKREIDFMLNFSGDPKGIPQGIVDKAIKHATMRASSGRSPFIESDESRIMQNRQKAASGKVINPLRKRGL